jgi:kumamolisin
MKKPTTTKGKKSVVKITRSMRGYSHPVLRTRTAAATVTASDDGDEPVQIPTTLNRGPRPIVSSPDQIPTTLFVPLPGSQRSLLPDSRSAGPVDPKEIASIIVRVRSAAKPKALETAVRKLYAQPVAKRRYLTHDQLAHQFGASSKDFDLVEEYARKNNLSISGRSQRQRRIVLTGKLKDLLSAFRADVRLFHHASGSYRGRHGEIYIPKQLSGIITGIFGFDTRRKHKVTHRFRAAVPQTTNQGMTSIDFARRYNFPTTYKGRTLDGDGQCIAIIELGGGFSNSDLDVYFQSISVPVPNVTAVSVNNGINHPTPSGDADGEVLLDIEVAGAVAPKAKLAVYFAPNEGSGFLDAISAAVHDSERKPSVVSISWGGPEDPVEKQSLDAFHELFVEAAALGVTICAASGDHGVADLDGHYWDKKVHVDHPACDDYVLACGGTQIDPTSKQDVAWNDGLPFNAPPYGGGWASGGGVSAIFPLPTYQKSAKVPASIAAGHPRGRGVPDIAMSADNYRVRVHGQDQISGGTSAVAPLMSALVVLLNQAKKKNVGFLNPLLYAKAKSGVVKDVIKGNNGITGSVKGYSAGPGWDACTGLGTPDGMKLLNEL